MIPTTYTGIISAVAALAEDDSDEFISYIPTALHLSEERLIKEIDLEGLKTIASVVASVSNPLIAKASGYRYGHDVSYNTSTGRVFLTKKTDDFLQDYWPNQTSVGRPKYYADRSDENFIVAPAPASAYNFQIKFSRRLSKLGTTRSSNYFSEFCSDALFYATMSNMAEFMKDYTVQQVWENKYAIARDALNNQGRRERRDDASYPTNEQINVNTLKQEN